MPKKPTESQITGTSEGMHYLWSREDSLLVQSPAVVATQRRAPGYSSSESLVYRPPTPRLSLDRKDSVSCRHPIKPTIIVMWSLEEVYLRKIWQNAFKKLEHDNDNIN